MFEKQKSLVLYKALSTKYYDRDNSLDACYAYQRLILSQNMDCFMRYTWPEHQNFPEIAYSLDCHSAIADWLN